MKKNDFLTKSLLLGALSLATVACSNGNLPDVSPEGIPGGGSSRISIAVSTPASEGVVVRGLTRAIQDETESAINNLNVYLFKKGTGDSDTDYTYYKVYSFGADKPGGELEEGINGEKTCSIGIEKELMGETVKIALVANDEVELESGILTQNTTTLEDFKKALASATASNDDEADVLVGGADSKSFPMSVLVGEAKKLGPTGVNLKAELVRNVARLDVFNYTPNLKITGVRMENVNDRSRILGTDMEDGVNIPTGIRKIALSPLKEFSDKLRSGLAYQMPDETTEESARAKNTYRVSYLYEQEVTEGSTSPEVTIEYTLSIGGKEKSGEVTVQFKKTGEAAFVNVKRNRLYRIKLGDGTPVGTGAVKVIFQVADWMEGEDINTELEPDPLLFNFE